MGVFLVYVERRDMGQASALGGICIYLLIGWEVRIVEILASFKHV